MRNGESGMQRKKRIQTCCEDCVHYVYDEDMGETVCTMQLDEDEYAQYLTGRYRACPYYQPYDEYKVVQKQN